MRNKRRWLERGKSLLILLLSLSAVYLLSMTPLIRDSGVPELFAPHREESGHSAPVTLTAAARPARMVVNGADGRYGVQYNQSRVDELFARLGPLLGEALTSSGTPREITERSWQGYLGRTGIYFDFTGDIPLSALGVWLWQEGECALTAAARRVLLAAGNQDAVLLCYQDADSGLFYACDTALLRTLHLEPAVEGISGNDAQFAFESREWSGLLRPYTLITEENGRQVYAASTPLSPGGDLSQILDALGYTGRNHASVSGGELYLDGNDRLRILSGGRIVYDAAQGGKYPVAAVGERATLAEAIEAARDLAESTIGTQCGEAEVYLMSAQETDEGYVIRFGYRLDGSSVWLYEEGWAAEFLIQSDAITNFTLLFRSYAPTGEQALLPALDMAVVMLPDLTEEQRELILRYQDGGDSTVRPVWVAD